MAEIQQKLQALSSDYQQVQDDLQSTLLARQKLESQLEENRSVQKEFDSLPAITSSSPADSSANSDSSSSSNIYKLVGTVLLRQDKNEARATVAGRLEFIEKEIKRVEGGIKDLQAKGEKVRGEIGLIQQQQQQQEQGGQQGGGLGDASVGK